MICFICLGLENASIIKAQFCNQHFHIDCVDLWELQERFTRHTCHNADEFMASLPFQKFELVNAQGTLPPSHKINMAI